MRSFAKLFYAFVLGLLLVSAGCASAQPNTAPTGSPGPATGSSHASAPTGRSAPSAPAFSEVQPLIQNTFAPLLTEDEQLDASSWQGLIQGSEHGEVLIPYDPENSLLVEVAEAARAEGRSGAPTEAEVERVRQWIAAGAKSDAGDVPYADADQLLYVPNQGEALISVIDMEANLVIRTIDLQEHGFGPNAKPHHTAVDADGSHWYVSLIGENRVLKFNRENELVGQAEFEVPGLMGVDPATNRLYVGRSMSAVNPPKSIGVIDRESLRVEEISVFFPRPHALGIDPDGKQIYVASLAQNQIATINAETGQMELTSQGGPINTLVHFAVSPSGEEMVAGGQLSGTFFFYDTSTPPTPTVTDSIQIGGQPWHPVYTPDGSRVYVGNKTANTVTVIDAEAREVETTIEAEGIAQPHGSAVRPDGRYVYISGNNRKGAYTPRYDLGDNRNSGTVTVIDTRTNEVVKTIEVEDYPTGLGTQPRS